MMRLTSGNLIEGEFSYSQRTSDASLKLLDHFTVDIIAADSYDLALGNLLDSLQDTCSLECNAGARPIVPLK